MAALPLFGASVVTSCAQAQVHAPSGWALEAAPVAYNSHWREFDAQGARLLREDGLLRGGVVKARVDWLGAHWFVAGQAVSGQRRYDGQDNAGMPAQTDVQVNVRQWQVGGQYQWPTGWLVGWEAQSRHQKRELLSIAGGAQGYVERWRGDMAWLRLGYAQRCGAGQAYLSWALAPWSRTTLDLAMPGHDPARLRPELDQAMQLQAGWRSEPMPGGWVGWRWGIQGELEQRRFDRSEAVPLKRNGRLIGVVRQPQTEEVGTSVALQLSHHW